MNASRPSPAQGPRFLVVVTEKKTAELVGPGSLDADTFLGSGDGLRHRATTVYNLCRSLAYRSPGYYVSLVAEARGQDVLPSVATLSLLGDSTTLFDQLEEAGLDVVHPSRMTARRRTLKEKASGAWVIEEEGGRLCLASDREVREIEVMLGTAEAKADRRVAAAIYRVVPVPLLRVTLMLEQETWCVVDVSAAGISQLDEAGRDRLVALLAEPPQKPRSPGERLPALGIVYDEGASFAPSTPETIERIERIGARRGMHVTRMRSDEPQRLASFDAIFLRVLTGPTLPSYRLALRAEALGLPVVDDPQSIFRCSNKVFLHELLQREDVPTPPTELAAPTTPFSDLEDRLGLPFVVKVPDGSFSTGVHRIGNESEYRAKTAELFDKSPLLVVQGWMPTPFDWRVTVLGGKVLFVARYHMAEGHWQIRAEGRTGARYGRVEAVARRTAPRDVTRLALKAAALIGDGLYGVDIKPGKDGPVVIEVNDNPNLDIGYDDAADGNAIYEDLIDWFRERIAKANRPARPPQSKQARAKARDPLRKPIGPRTKQRIRDDYRPFEVCGLELEYAVVDRDLNAASLVEDALGALAGHPTSDVELGAVGFSNEIMDHVLEIKTTWPPRSLVEAERWLHEGVDRLSTLLHQRFDARLLPTGMHPWLRPAQAQVWSRSNNAIYGTYQRLFDVRTHGWANVQAVHVNLPLGTEEEGVAMMNAAALLVPYLPAFAASSPIHDGEIQSSVDNRMAHVLEHQQRLPASCGDIVPEPMTGYRQYRRDVFQPMYEAVDRLPDAASIRHEFLNARGAVIKFSRKSMEVRVLDMQECVKMDVAISVLVRSALKGLAAAVLAGRLERPDQALLVDDLRATVRHGTSATVHAPHLRDDDVREGPVPVGRVLRRLLDLARKHVRKDEAHYLDEIEPILERGNLSERISAQLMPYADDEESFVDATRRLYVELSECLRENRPWSGR